MDDKTAKDIYDLLVKSLPKLQSDLTYVKEVADSNKRALRGTNGETGLVARVETLCNDQSKIWKKIEEHDQVLYHGKDENEPGLQDQMREIRREQKSVKRLAWLLISAIVVGLVNIVLSFVEIGVPTP